MAWRVKGVGLWWGDNTPRWESQMQLTLCDVYAARQRIADVALTTPLMPSSWGRESGNDLLLKLETTQPTRAFKLRGAANAIACLSAEQKQRGVVCCSTGNHGRGVAYAARLAGVTATICLSDLVPDGKAKAIETLGAKVCRVGRSQDDALVETQRIVSEEGAHEISPFDNEKVAAGQATIALELFEKRPELQTIAVPLSGGGLAGGVAFAAKQIHPGCNVIGVSMERGAAMHASLKAGHPVEVEEHPSLADALVGGIGMDNRLTFSLCQRFLDDVILVTEEEIYEGMRTLFRYDGVVAEGASAVCHGALLAGKLKLRGASAFVISGANVDMKIFEQVINGETVRLGDMEVCL